MSFEQFRTSLYYGAHADMQFKFLAAVNDQAAAYQRDDTPTVDDAPFTPLPLRWPSCDW